MLQENYSKKKGKVITFTLRIYSENAEPLPWSTRTRVMKYKYVDNEASKDCLVNFVKRNVRLTLN